MDRSFGSWVAILLLLVGGCASIPATGATTLKADTLGKLERHLLDNRADVDQFRARGPFKFHVQEDHELLVSPTERVQGDLYISMHAETAPLVILLHGSGNSKEDHAYQALHLATWGMHSLSLQLPAGGPWTRNGRTLARVVNFLSRRPDAFGRRIDPKKIILVGHSFGGSAVMIALGEGAPAAGGILLDPAGIGRTLPGYLQKVRRPVIMIASDPRVNIMRQRGDFYKYVRGNVAEISIKGAHHDDATFPIESGLFSLGSDATEEHQITFVSALTAAALSLAFTASIDYAWASYDEGLKTGKMFDPHRK